MLLAFAMSGILETQLQQHPKSTGMSQRRMLTCNDSQTFNFTKEQSTSNQTLDDCLVIKDLQTESYFVSKNLTIERQQKLENSPSTMSVLRLETNFKDTHRVDIREHEGIYEWSLFHGTDSLGPFTGLGPPGIDVLVDDVVVADFKLKTGSVAIISLTDRTDGGVRSRIAYSKEPDLISIWWILPQYMTMSLGEVMFSPTGLSFAYSQAPSTMKSLMQAVWMLMVAFGNVITIIIVGLFRFKSQVGFLLSFKNEITSLICFFSPLRFSYSPYLCWSICCCSFILHINMFHRKMGYSCNQS